MTTTAIEASHSVVGVACLGEEAKKKVRRGKKVDEQSRARAKSLKRELSSCD